MLYRERPWTLVGLGMTRAVKWLLVITIALFVVQRGIDIRTGRSFTLLFGLSSVGLSKFFLWQLVTYMFLHGGLWHLALNMLLLAILGREMETVLGTKRFLVLYFACGILAGLGWVLLSGFDASLCIGASGAVFGVLGAFAGMYPTRQITLLLFFILPVTMTARTMAAMLGLIAFLSIFLNEGTNIAHTAHLAGGIAGYLFGLRVARRGVARRRSAPAAGWTPTVVGRAVRERHERPARFPEPPPSDEPPTQEDVDRLLDKITAQGMNSLSRTEREILERASRAWRE